MCASIVARRPRSFVIAKTTFSPFCATGSGANGSGGRACRTVRTRGRVARNRGEGEQRQAREREAAARLPRTRFFFEAWDMGPFQC